MAYWITTSLIVGAIWILECCSFSRFSSHRYLIFDLSKNEKKFNNESRFMTKISMVASHNVINFSLRELRDHKRDAKYLRDRIQIWLDGECNSHEVHATVSKIVEAQYLQSRKTGVDNLEQLEKQITSRLESVDMTGSFMNAHDVVKKCSNLILLLLNQKLCLQQFYDEDGDCQALEECGLHMEKQRESRSFMTAEKFEALANKFKSEFMRYRLLRDFLEGDVDWEEVQPMMEILLGCRSVDMFTQTKHIPHLAPRNWKETQFYPDFSNASDIGTEERLRRDIPPNENDADIILETLMGGEYLKLVKQEGSLDMGRRMLVAQWMYSHGFLYPDFPPKEEVIPGHLLTKDTEDEWSQF